MLMWSRLVEKEISYLIVCHCSTACSPQSQLPNDAASCDPIGKPIRALERPARLQQHPLPNVCTGPALDVFQCLAHVG